MPAATLAALLTLLPPGAADDIKPDAAEARGGAAAAAGLDAALAEPAGAYFPGGLELPAGTSVRDGLDALLAPAGLVALPDVPALALDHYDLGDMKTAGRFALPPGSPLPLRRAVALLLRLSGEPLTLLTAGGVPLVTTAIEAENTFTVRTYDVSDLTAVDLPRAAAAGLLVPHPNREGFLFTPFGELTSPGIYWSTVGWCGFGSYSFPVTSVWNRKYKNGAHVGDDGDGTDRENDDREADDRADDPAGGDGGGPLEAAATDRLTVRTPEGPVTVTVAPGVSLETAKLVLADGAWEPVRLHSAEPLVAAILDATGGPDAGGDWDINGGLGSVTELPPTPAGPDGRARVRLVVRQTEAVHRQIAALLTTLRDGADGVPPQAPAGEDD